MIFVADVAKEAGASKKDSKGCCQQIKAIENGYIVFETTHLSQYGIIATNTVNETKSPQTGDNSNLALWFAILAISGDAVIGVTVIGKKKKHSVK